MPVPEWLTSASIGGLLNSAFTTSLVGALAGAFAGAHAAQRVAERAKEGERLLTQIRSTNAAITAAFTTCNQYMALKRQHVRPQYQAFLAARADFDAFQAKRSAKAIPADQCHEFVAMLHTVQMPEVPIGVLKNLVFDRLSVGSRVLALTIATVGVAATLGDLLNRHALLVERFKQIPPGSNAATAALYFGREVSKGSVNTEYPDTMEAISAQTDDGIFFSHRLCKDLAEYGEEVLGTYRKHAKGCSERVITVDFRPALAMGLLPDEANYADWLRGFQEQRPSNLSIAAT